MLFINFASLLILFLDNFVGDQNKLTLKDCYDLGIYVFCGQHETLALQQLCAENPETDEYRYLTFETVCVFTKRSEELFQKLRIAGYFVNDVRDIHQIRNWVTKIQNTRVYFNQIGGRAFNIEDKVFFFP